MKMNIILYLAFSGLRKGLATALCCAFGWLLSAHSADTWTDVTSALMTSLTNQGVKLDWPGGCSGVVVNRTNGSVTIKVVGRGLWRSADEGRNWERVDPEQISGRDETGWATSADADNPGRMASFSLDGSAGWTIDGIHWNRFTTLGRNWDYGSVDWSAAVPKTIIAAKHETTPPGEVYLTQDGGSSWHLLPIHLSENRGHISMLGALGPAILIYSNGDGIHRSADAGAAWAKVSPLNPQTRIPVYFRTVQYLGSAEGLLSSRDQGNTWQKQGAKVDIWLGPYFGRDEKQMVVVGKDGIFYTKNGGEFWQAVAQLKAKERGFLFTPNWFGCYAWDPVANLMYVSAMGNPVYKLKL